MGQELPVLLRCLDRARELFLFPGAGSSRHRVHQGHARREHPGYALPPGKSSQRPGALTGIDPEALFEPPDFDVDRPYLRQSQGRKDTVPGGGETRAAERRAEARAHDHPRAALGWQLRGDGGTSGRIALAAEGSRRGGPSGCADSRLPRARASAGKRLCAGPQALRRGDRAVCRARARSASAPMC